MDGRSRFCDAALGDSSLCRAAARARVVANAARGDADAASEGAAALSASQLIVMLAVIAMATTLACGGIGYGLATGSDDTAAGSSSARRCATPSAEFRALFGKAARSIRASCAWSSKASASRA